jgi:hypothetical protein
MTVEDIEEAILRLGPRDLARLRAWFAEFETGMAPPGMVPPGMAASQSRREMHAVRLGRLAGRAVADIRRRIREP